jgi:hypothetical protein
METVECGIALTGTEVKSVREGRCNLKDSYGQIRQGEALLLNAHISPYSHGNRENHEPTELASEETHDIRDAAAHHLADTDLLRALLGAE